ncbi:hypothetical protein NE237_017784 [Protea cynaroides]|uniref:Uncharacterized protein n=1 Tax=Protea cynaroides TaxID=273540 RepID=A0A9Q0QNB1_9MAGN|nr:hypothetical protein NE237_017784 [Protea cynaroides]
MGGCFSVSSLPSFDIIRLVHFDGFVEDIDDSVTVAEIASNPPKCFVCTPAQLLCFSSSKALPQDTQLQRGHLYFILPLKTLQWEASPVDFISLATRLNKVAKQWGSINAKHQQRSPVSDLLRTMRRSKSTTERVSLISEQDKSVEQEPVVKMDRHKMSCRVPSWKPILETINEKSFGRRSESDLHSPLIRTAVVA